MDTPAAAPRRDDRGRAAAADVVAGTDDRALIRRMLALTPEQRLRGLAHAADFFRSARRV